MQLALPALTAHQALIVFQALSQILDSLEALDRAFGIADKSEQSPACALAAYVTGQARSVLKLKISLVDALAKHAQLRTERMIEMPEGAPAPASRYFTVLQETIEFWSEELARAIALTADPN